MSDSVELKFPVVAHHRVIVNAAEKDVAKMRELFADFELVEPLAEARASSGDPHAPRGPYPTGVCCILITACAIMFS